MNKNENEVIDIENITDDDIISIDIFGSSSDVQLSETDIDMMLDDDADFSLVEESLSKMDDNQDTHLKLAAMFGIDLSTGKDSRGLDKDLTNILIDLEVEEEEDETEQGVVEVNKEFTDIELERQRNIYTGIFAFHKDQELADKYKLYTKQLDENNKNRNTLIAQLKKVERDVEPETNVFKKLMYIENLYKKLDSKEPLTKKEKEVIESIDRKEMTTILKQKRKYLIRVQSQIKELNESISVCDKIEEEILTDIKHIREVRNKDSLVDIQTKVDDILNRTKKIVQIQYGISLYSAEFKERPIAVRCACGHSDVYEATQLPYYVSGNIYNNFKERSYINKNVQKNMYNNRDTTKSGETRNKLVPEGNMIESRVHFPGITDNEGEPLKCKGCGSFLSFPPDIVDKLSQRGFMLDVFNAELSATSAGKKLDLTEGVKVFLNPAEIDSKYIADLGLSEYKLSKISSNIKDIDLTETKHKLGSKNRIDENSLRIYAGRPTGEINLKQVEEELRGHINNINIAIDDLIKKYRVPKRKDGLSGPALVKYINTKERNESINRFLRNSRGIILKYAIDTKISSKRLKSIIHEYESNIGEFKKLILKFLVDYLIDSVIEGRPTFVFEEGYARTIDNKQMVLPHTNFFACYKPLIKNYFLMGELSQVKKDFELTEYYNLFRSLSNISKIPDHDARVIKSEEFVKTFRNKLDRDFHKKYEGIYKSLRNLNGIIEHKSRVTSASNLVNKVRDYMITDFGSNKHNSLLVELEESYANKDYESMTYVSDNLIDSLSEAIKNEYEKTKSSLFFEYIKDTVKIESNYDFMGKCFCWLYYEMITQDKIINQTEVADRDLFETLYGEELREKGHFYIFQSDKNSF